MADVHSKAIRKKNMRAVRAKDTKPELFIRKLLHKAGFRYRLHVKSLPGKPDIVLRKYSVVIFVHGCFWHKHDCRFFRLPSTRPEWWDQKLSENRARSDSTEDFLREQGWRVVVIWECSFKGKDRLRADQILEEFTLWLESGSSYLELPRHSF